MLYGHIYIYIYIYVDQTARDPKTCPRDVPREVGLQSTAKIYPYIPII